MTRHHVLVYRDNDGDWRWQVSSSNGRVLGDSGEGYRNRSHCLRMARSLFPDATLEVSTDDWDVAKWERDEHRKEMKRG